MDKFRYFSSVLNIILENKDYFIKNILASPHNLKFFMSEDLPQLVCDRFGGTYEVIPVKSVSADLKNSCGYNIYLIEYEPSFVVNVSDCYALIIATKDDEIRLFSFEKGTSILNNKKINFVCETTQDGLHINYGVANNNLIKTFLDKVVEILK